MKKYLYFIIIVALFTSCSVKKYLVYEPADTEEVFSFYANGLPINSIATEEEFILFSVDETELFSNPYIRVWLLYENNSENPYLLEPYKIISLQAEKEGELFDKYFAESPTKILAAIEEEKAIALVFKTVGSTLEAMSVEGTKIKSNTGEVYDINDEKEKRSAILQINKNDMQSTVNWYNRFSNSINSGVLRKNTVFPGQAVNGYLYFPIKNVDGTGHWNQYFTDIEDLKFYLILNSKAKVKKVELRQTDIW